MSLVYPSHCRWCCQSLPTSPEGQSGHQLLCSSKHLDRVAAVQVDPPEFLIPKVDDPIPVVSWQGVRAARVRRHKCFGAAVDQVAQKQDRKKKGQTLLVVVRHVEAVARPGGRDPVMKAKPTVARTNQPPLAVASSKKRKSRNFSCEEVIAILARRDQD